MSAEAKRRILVTDDDADIANLMRIILSKTGYEVTVPCGFDGRVEYI